MRLVTSALLALVVLSGCGGPATKADCAPDCEARTCGSDGCGGSCGTCKAWQVCPGTACILDTESRWDLVADHGSVSVRTSAGERWDGVADPSPDPFVCVSFDGPRQCTVPAENNFAPMWMTKLYSKVPARTLQTGIFVQYFDEDGATDDVVCYGDIVVHSADFNAGFFDATCDGNSSDVVFKLVHVPE